MTGRTDLAASGSGAERPGRWASTPGRAGRAGGAVRRRAWAVAALALTLATGCYREGSPDADAPVRLELTGLDLRQEVAGRLAGRIRAERVEVQPKRLGHLQVAPLSELVLTRPRIDLFEAPRAAGDAGPAQPARGGGAPPEDRASPPGGRSFVSRLPILGLGRVRHLVGAALVAPVLTFVRDGAAIARVEAERGVVAGRGQELVLHGFRLEHPASGRTVTARRATWAFGEGAFRIAGEAVVEQGGITSRHRGVQFDVGFEGRQLR